MGKNKRSAKKAKDTMPATSEPEVGSPVLFVRMPPKVQEAFEAYLNDDPLESTRQNAGLEALTMFLQAKGYWPRRS